VEGLSVATPTTHLGIPQIEAADAVLVADGLGRPEGPVALPDGDLLVVELDAGTLTRIRPDGSREVAGRCGGGPNGAAVGPDGAVYVCNNGGHWPDHYVGGSIQRVDLATGAVEVLYDSCDGHPLCGPNDLVFDADGGFWFTDTGKFRGRTRDEGGVYYARPDGSSIVEAIHPVEAPNGVGLSPDGRSLYYAETITGRLYRREIVVPGRLAPAPRFDPDGFVAVLPGVQLLDSLAVEAEGDICVATLLHGCVSVIAPDGTVREQIVPPPAFADEMVTNICFAGDDLRTAYITLSSTGRVIRCRWPRPGLALEF
jgi:gluconolactonase